MSKWIDADALIEMLHHMFSNSVPQVFEENAYDIISYAPSIDIVRCKECKKWHDWGDGECFCGRFEGGIGCSADDFCSYGEREGE